MRALSKVFRAKFRDGLETLRAQGKLRFVGRCAALSPRVEWARYLSHTLTSTPWVVYAKPPFGGPAVVLKYLSRYTHRIAIANRRLISVNDGVVGFRYRDYAEHNATKQWSCGRGGLAPLLLHVVPPGFKRIRHFGLLATRCRAAKLERCRQLLLGQVESTDAVVAPDGSSKLPLTAEAEPQAPQRRCPNCGSHRVSVIERLPPVRAGPPFP